ncbi:hypothetical protein LPJ64_005918, partial [Coemansia asiatica]
MNSDQQHNSSRLQSTMVLGSRLAAIVLSCISVICSLIVVVSYIRMLRRFRAHQRKIIEASMGHSGSNGVDHPPLSVAAAVANDVAATCFSCESSLATPCVSKSFFSSNSHQLGGVPSSNGKLHSAAGAANGMVSVGIGMTPQNVLLQFREPSINNSSSAGGNSGSGTSAPLPPASIHRSSMPPLPQHMPLSVDSKHKTSNGSRATSLDRIYGAYGRLSSGGIATNKKQQRSCNNGQSASAFPATLDVVASAPASAAASESVSASASAFASLSASSAEQGQQQPLPAAAAATTDGAVPSSLEPGVEAVSNAKPPHADAAWPHQSESRKWPWSRSHFWSGWLWRPG